ncbi:MAG: hypothetical protein FD180_1293 [Planctomycetota bacterium]|nr:MAG: hypothetical protein FD180_1293 [Planctomycetota bacterium]
MSAQRCLINGSIPVSTSANPCSDEIELPRSIAIMSGSNGGPAPPAGTPPWTRNSVQRRCPLRILGRANIVPRASSRFVAPAGNFSSGRINPARSAKGSPSKFPRSLLQIATRLRYSFMRAIPERVRSPFKEPTGGRDSSLLNSARSSGISSSGVSIPTLPHFLSRKTPQLTSTSPLWIFSARHASDFTSAPTRSGARGFAETNTIPGP